MRTIYTPCAGASYSLCPASTARLMLMPLMAMSCAVVASALSITTLPAWLYTFAALWLTSATPVVLPTRATVTGAKNDSSLAVANTVCDTSMASFGASAWLAFTTRVMIAPSLPLMSAFCIL